MAAWEIWARLCPASASFFGNRQQTLTDQAHQRPDHPISRDVSNTMSKNKKSSSLTDAVALWKELSDEIDKSQKGKFVLLLISCGLPIINSYCSRHNVFLSIQVSTSNNVLDALEYVLKYQATSKEAR